MIKQDQNVRQSYLGKALVCGSTEGVPLQTSVQLHDLRYILFLDRQLAFQNVESHRENRPTVLPKFLRRINEILPG